MIAHPELGYVENGVDFRDPALYAPSRGRFGTARILTPLAFRSVVFADLEDEAIWTRSWVCIGSHREIPQEGDLLPYTVGDHGVHVQREAKGFTGRFNLAQHGGCRFIPAQCQTGQKTKCSFTSCGYSRDREAIPADMLGDNTPEMRQYLGFRPERLLPVKVDVWGPLLFVNLDTDADALEDCLGDIGEALALTNEPGGDSHAFQTEYPGNWKLFGAALVRRLAGTCAGDRREGALLLPVDADPAGERATLFWLFPNLILSRTAHSTTSIVLQPTALDRTLARIRIDCSAPLARNVIEAWRQALDDAGDAAEERQAGLARFGTPSLPETSLDDLPLEEDHAAHALQAYVIAQVLEKRTYNEAGPLYTATMR